MPFQKEQHLRVRLLSLILAVALLICGVRMLSLQVIHANQYISQGSGITARTSVLKAPRGEILDCYGREIAVNRDGYNIVFNSAYLDWDHLNDLILTLCDYLSAENVAWVDELPLSKTAPYGFTDEDPAAFLKNIGLAHYATAENAFTKLTALYHIDGLSSERARLVMGVRYSMSKAAFSLANPYTFAEDVPAGIMQKISENSFCLPGVTVETAPFRSYVDSTLAPHLIGTVGPIYAEEWNGDPENGVVGLKEKGYHYNDKVGKSGIEAYCEDLLHGTDGEITYYLNADGMIISSEITKQPIPGKTVMLTLDKRIQQTVQNTLLKTIDQLNENGGRCTGGAAVVMNVKTGQIFASANAPTYDRETYQKQYETLLSNPNNPLINRAFQGIYPIGSTIKPAVAIAALDAGSLTADERITCQHTYTLFNDYRPSCMGTHGPIDLKLALAASCNYYFFEVGRRVGATTMGRYFNQFGLGVKTGVEIGDSAGLFVKTDEGTGDTLQIAIGQKNAFTPLQMAVYTSTLANGGTRYRATLIDKVVSYDLKETYQKNGKEVLNTITISDYALKSVKEGMLSVTEDGTGSRVLGDYPIKVGGKTGTSQVNYGNGVDNSVFIAFAPFDDPEIAIAVILEHGNNGFAAGTIVRNALDAYFFSDETSVNTTPSYTVLG